MAIEPIKGFYVHDEATDTDGVAKYDAEQLAGDVPEVVGIRTGYDGTVYPSAGDAVRGFEENIYNDYYTLFDGNMFDGNYKKGLIASTTGGTKFTENNDGKIAIVQCEPNTTYSCIRIMDGNDHYGRILLTDNSGEDVQTGDVMTGRLIDIGGLSSYTFTTSETQTYIWFAVTYTGLDAFVQIVEGTQTTVTTEQYKGYIPKFKDADLALNTRFVKTGDNISIYVRSPIGTYMKFDYVKRNVPAINLNTWKLYKITFLDNELNTLFAFGDDVEWDGVVKVQGATDFIGGYHGDETNTAINVLVDNQEIDITGSDVDIWCTNVKIVNTSIVNACDDVSNELFKRIKVHEWGDNQFTITNKWTALKQVTLTHCYMTMIGTPMTYNGVEIASFARNNDSYIPQDLDGDVLQDSIYYPSLKADAVEIWGKYRASVTHHSKLWDSNNRHVVIGDRSQSNTFKAYFNSTATNPKQFNAGDVIDGKSTYKFYY